MDQDTCIEMVRESYVRIAAEAGIEATAPADESTSLVGPESALDSMALVSLVLDLEQRLEEEHGMAMSLLDERALSRSRSPFRTIGTLAAYVLESTSDEASTD